MKVTVMQVSGRGSSMEETCLVTFEVLNYDKYCRLYISWTPNINAK